MSNVTVGTVRKSMAIVPARWLRRKVLQVCGRRLVDAGAGVRAVAERLPCTPEPSPDENLESLGVIVRHEYLRSVQRHSQC